MRKNKIASVMAFFIAVAVSFLFFSCKSTSAAGPKANDVPPLDVLDGNADFFVYIPTKTNQDFVSNFLTLFMEGISEKDAGLIASRTEEIAIATKDAKQQDFQMSAKGSYPQIAIKKSFTENKGWKKEIYAVDGVSYEIFKSKGTSGTELNASFPENLALIGTNLEDALERYTFLAFDEVSPGSMPPASWNKNIYNYLLSGKNGEIMFFAKNPAIALKAFLGKGINLGMKTVSGRLYAPKNSKYSLDISIELSDPRTMKAALSIVKLAIFPNAAKISMQDASHIKIQDLNIDYKTLFSMFTTMN